MKRKTSETRAVRVRGNTRRLILLLRELQKSVENPFPNSSTFASDNQPASMERRARTAANQPIMRQRRVSSRPLGKRSGRNTRNKTQFTGQKVLPSHLTTSVPGSGRSPFPILYAV